MAHFESPRLFLNSGLYETWGSNVNPPNPLFIMSEPRQNTLSVLQNQAVLSPWHLSRRYSPLFTAKPHGFAAIVPRAFTPPSNIIKPWSMAMIPGNSGVGANSSSSGDSSGSSSSPSGSSSSSSSSSSSPGKHFSIFSLFPCNPSLGLFLVAPLVPAPDNRPALALLTSIQLLFGLSLMTRRIPKLGESRIRSRAAAGARFSMGSVLVFLSGIESLRLVIPCDPWAEEAKEWRHWAVKHGHNPSWWFGGISYYTPLSISQWKHKTTSWLANTIHTLELEDAEEEARLHDEKDADLLTSISLGPRAVLKTGEANTYADIHETLHTKNCKRSRDLLDGELRDVTELNKAERLDALLENRGHVHLNEEYVKPNIQLGTHTLQTDEEFEMVWANFEPWDELRQETDFDVRLIPRWRCIDELSDE